MVNFEESFNIIVDHTKTTYNLDWKYFNKDLLYYIKRNAIKRKFLDML